MSRYRMTLKPIDSFFFSGEKSFKYLGETNIAKSNCFPQQTSILGMLRKEMLKITDNYSETWNYNSSSKKEIDKIIGNFGFEIEKNENENGGYGVIKGISPVCLKHKDEILINMPRDLIKAFEENEAVIEENIKTISFREKGIKLINGKQTFLPSEIKVKNYNPNYFVSICKKLNNEEDGLTVDEKKLFVKKEDVFIEEKQVGIKLNTNKKAGENDFYRIVKYRLTKGFTFVVDVLIDKSFKNDLDGYSNMVNMGGEKSIFKLAFTKIKDDEDALKDKIQKFLRTHLHNCQTSNYKYRVICLSDVYTDTDILSEGDYAIRSFCDFRYRIQVNSKNKNDYTKSFKPYNSKLSFMEKGSVIYTNNIDNIKEKVSKYTSLTEIGYNSIIILENK